MIKAWSSRGSAHGQPFDGTGRNENADGELSVSTDTSVSEETEPAEDFLSSRPEKLMNEPRWLEL